MPAPRRPGPGSGPCTSPPVWTAGENPSDRASTKGMGDAGVEGEARRPAGDADDAESRGVGIVEDRRAGEALHDECARGGQVDQLLEPLGDLGQLGPGGQASGRARPRGRRRRAGGGGR